MTNESTKQLIQIWKKRGARHPANPFKILPPSHPYTKLLIKKYTLELKVDFKNKPEESEKIFKEVEEIEEKIDKMKEKMGDKK